MRLPHVPAAGIVLGIVLVSVGLPLSGAAASRTWGQTLPSPLGVDTASDVSGDSLAFVEVSLAVEVEDGPKVATVPFRVWAGEELELTLRFGFERRFRTAQLVQLFHRELDVPAQLRAPWLEGVPEQVPAEPAHDEGAAQQVGRTVAVGSEIVLARSLGAISRAGVEYDAYELIRRVRFDAPGEVQLTAPRMRFAFADSFREDALHGRVPEGRNEGFVRGNALSLDVDGLPEAGRAPSFSGAVGLFTTHVQVAPRDVALGEGVVARWTVRGTGHLAGIAAPRFPRTALFDVRGVLEVEAAETERAFAFDLLPRRAGSLVVPSIPFQFFDPKSDTYRLAKSSEVDVVVREPSAPPTAADATTAPQPQQHFGPDSDLGSEPNSGPRSNRWLWALLPVGLLLMWWIQRRGNSSSMGNRRSPVTSELREQLASESTVGDAFLEVLARQLECTPAAVVGPRLAERLHTTGLSMHVATRAAGLSEALLAPRYGGPTLPNGVGATREVIDALERELGRS